MITIDYKASKSIHEQLIEKITSLVAVGVFEAGSQIPSIRNLATELSINPNTIVKAFDELERNGVIVCLKGRGNFVVDDITKLLKTKETDILNNAQQLASYAKTYGVKKEKLIDKINQVYQLAL